MRGLDVSRRYLKFMHLLDDLLQGIMCIPVIAATDSSDCAPSEPQVLPSQSSGVGSAHLPMHPSGKDQSHIHDCSEATFDRATKCGDS